MAVTRARAGGPGMFHCKWSWHVWRSKLARAPALLKFCGHCGWAWLVCGGRAWFTPKTCMCKLHEHLLLEEPSSVGVIQSEPTSNASVCVNTNRDRRVRACEDVSCLGNPEQIGTSAQRTYSAVQGFVSVRPGPSQLGSFLIAGVCRGLACRSAAPVLWMDLQPARNMSFKLTSQQDVCVQS